MKAQIKHIAGMTSTTVVYEEMTFILLCTELKREIRIWERAEKTLPTVTGEEQVIRDALKAKVLEVKKQLHDERRLRWECSHHIVWFYSTIKWT